MNRLVEIASTVEELRKGGESPNELIKYEPGIRQTFPILETLVLATPEDIISGPTLAKLMTWLKIWTTRGWISCPEGLPEGREEPCAKFAGLLMMKSANLNEEDYGRFDTL